MKKSIAFVTLCVMVTFIATHLPFASAAVSQNCVRSATPVDYATAEANGWLCSTPAAAWAAMNAGDTARITNGDFTTGCSISGSKASTTTFIGTGPSTTRLVCTNSSFTGNFAAFQDLSLYQVSFDADNLSLANVEVTCTDSAPYQLYSFGGFTHCGSWFKLTGSNFTWIGGRSGPTYDFSEAGCNPAGSPEFNDIGGGNSQPDNILIRNVKFDTVLNDGCDDQHSEVLRIDGGTNITLDRVWMDCGGTTGLLFVSTQGSSATEDNLTIQNSIFTDAGECAYPAGTGGTAAIDFNPDASPGAPTDVHLYNNVLVGALVAGTSGGSYTGMIVANTVWRGANPCPEGAGITYHNNAPYQPSTGGTTDRCGGDSNQIAVGTTSDNLGPPSSWLTCGANCIGATPATYTLKTGSPLINAGSNTYNPSDDYGGIITRPCGGTVDVGIWEFGC